LNHGLQGRPGRFHQLRPHLLEQFPALVGREGLDQLLLGCRQHAAEANQDQVADQMGVDLLGTAAHILLFEAVDPLADSGFDLALCLHAHLKRVATVPVRQTRSASTSPSKTLIIMAVRRDRQ